LFRALVNRALTNIAKHVFRATFGCDREAGRESILAIVILGRSEADRVTVKGVLDAVAPAAAPLYGLAVEVTHLGGSYLPLPGFGAIGGVTAAGLDGFQEAAGF